MNEKILVVEDDDAILQAISIKLEKEGYQAVTAMDGDEGLEKLKTTDSIAAILLDLRMPKGDGFTFLEKKAQDPKISSVPVIVFTNLSQIEYIERARSFGVKGYLVKAHHSLAEIIEELKKCLKGVQVHIDY